jgi:hypothetical protein
VVDIIVSAVLWLSQAEVKSASKKTASPSTLQ